MRHISSHVWPVRGLRWIFYFLLATAPLVPFRYVMLDGMPGPVVLLVRHFPTVLCLSVGLIWLLWRWGCVGAHIRRVPLGYAVLGMGAVGVLSSLGSAQPEASVAREVYYFLTGGMLFIAVADVCSVDDRAERLMALLVGTGYAVALYGLVEFWLGYSPIYGLVFNVENEVYLRLSPDPWFGNRIMSSIGHPVFLGAYLVLVLPIAMGYVFRAQNRMWQVGFLLGALALFVALVLTFSRGAWVGGMAAALLYLKRRGMHVGWAGVGGIAGLGVLGVLVVYVSGSSGVFYERIRDAYEMFVLNFAATSRGVALGHVIEVVERAPLLGVGTGMYRFQAYALREMAWPPTLDTPDNMYLLRLAEHGLLGLFAMAFFMVQIFQLLSRMRRDGRDREWAMAFEASFAGFFVDLLTCSAWSFPALRMVFWMLVGRCVGTLHVETLKNDDGRQTMDDGKGKCADG